jgi:hypothetical protein
MMATPSGEPAFLYKVEIEVEEELIVVESLPEVDADGVPTAEWVQDPDAQRYEVSLRTLLGAIEAVENDA